MGEQGVKNKLQRFPGFVGFTVGQGKNMDLRVMGAKGGADLFGVQGRDGRVSDDERLAGAREIGIGGGLADQSCAYRNRIATRAQVNQNVGCGMGIELRHNGEV